MSELKQLLDEAVEWYVPDAAALDRGVRRRARRRAAHRWVLTSATSLVIFAIGAILLWAAFRSTLSQPALPTTTPGTKIIVATGEDPVGVPWKLWLEIRANGISTQFGFRDAGWGSGCCDRGPMTTRPLQLNMSYSSMNHHPGPVVAWADATVKRVVFEGDTGERVEGAVYPVPGQPQGFTHMALVLLPVGVGSDGELIAYDESGAEIGRVPVEVIHTPPITMDREINRVWRTLRRASRSISRFGSPEAATLSTFDLRSVRQMFPSISWNDSPVAIPYEVSIRHLRPISDTESGRLVAWRLAIVSATPSGQPYCIAVAVDGYRRSHLRFGTQDARSFGECRGGWSEGKPTS